ncbi:lipocalin family protein [Photobacterium sanguinicancri]|uniref:Outer membrane lipoprotein Blc n=1 Tax=Photobacterium sanguinicancri TaxID=875932 RepID=A0AAW7Y4Z2_9GAMM|nr:lipocalin family protein [Photobacterium sanguinicancri]MDO6543492.1 lipocalin family protein [Photobacterium sanguinicancri]
MQIRALLLSLILLTGCTHTPDDIEPVKAFDINRFLGQWYEVARLDHSFESGLSNVTATYEMRKDQGINVVNRGFSADKEQWSEAIGKAYFVDKTDVGHLKVSFWGPFYSSYVVFELGDNYDYAFVSGYNKDYLWLLSRTPQVDPSIMKKFLADAKKKGFDTSKLIMVEHS